MHVDVESCAFCMTARRIRSGRFSFAKISALNDAPDAEAGIRKNTSHNWNSGNYPCRLLYSISHTIGNISVVGGLI